MRCRIPRYFSRVGLNIVLGHHTIIDITVITIIVSITINIITTTIMFTIMTITISSCIAIVTMNIVYEHPRLRSRRTAHEQRPRGVHERS